MSAATDGADKIAALRGGFVATIIGAVTTPLVVLLLLAPPVVGGLQRLFQRSSDRHRERSRRLAAEFLDALRGLRTVLLYGRVDDHAAHLAAASESQRRSVMRLLLGNQAILFVTDVVVYGGLVGAATATAVHLGSTGQLDAPRAVALVLLAVLLTKPLDHIGQFFCIGMTGVAAEKEVAGLSPAEPAQKSAPEGASARSGAVSSTSTSPIPTVNRR
ncbi:ABC transporter transmembrane domain-containing protein [Gordonia paraffinivorans]|uniref:ABC transporter transmembrane domain-containing protein n=1 Tax=Gordonia paraffinivorans TaxID=175628 RepID=UPI003C6CF2A1